MGSRVYGGATARTRKVPVVYCCPCGERFGAEVFAAVDSGDAEAKAALLEGRLNRVRCPSCDAISEVSVAVVYHDLRAPRLVLVLPDALRHRELEERARLYEQLALDRHPPPLYVLEAQVVFGAAGLRAVLAPPPSEAAFRAVATPTPSAVPLTRPGDTNPVVQLPVDDEITGPRVPDRVPSRAQQPEPEPVPEPAPARVPERAQDPIVTIAVKPPVDDEVHTRMRMAVPDPRAAMIERWIAGREGPAALLVDDAVLLCAALAPPQLEHFLPGRLELRVQLHRLPSYPVIALTLLAPPDKEAAGKRVDDARVLTVPLDVGRAAHRVVLDALGRRCTLAVELYDSQYLPVITHEVTAPLEENVRRLATEARDALERLAPPSRSFDRARAALFQSGYDRLGRTPVDLPDPTAEPLESPGAALAALSRVARWSEPGPEAYLVEIRSLPLAEWRALRARVIHRALDAGIAVARPLVERSAREHSSPLPSWHELLALQLRRFSEVSSRARNNDLSAAEEADNWEALLRECALAGVVVDDATKLLVAAALKRARAQGGAGVDMRALDSGELATLLERKELRREAALILCERHETPSLPPLFSVIRRMPRGEANMVLPALTQFGPSAEKWLIEGLKSKKSFMRQGCALALGTLKTPLGVDALVRLLLFEPTEIWTEVARALGDAGSLAVMPLAAVLREQERAGRRSSPATAEDTKERIIQALAQIAARGLRAPVEMLAAGRDQLVAQAAQRALVLAAEVKAADDKVRAGTTEQTVVRGFSRRFYEALTRGPEDLHGGGDRPMDRIEELDADELEEIDDPDGELPALKTLVNTAPTPRTHLPGDGR
jgi:hypothetical protein